MMRYAVAIWVLLICVGSAHAQFQPSNCDFVVDNSSTGCGGSGCSNSNSGVDLAHAWVTLAKLATQNLVGQTACLVGQSNPNTTNGGIWREQYVVKGQGTAWGSGTQTTITAYDITKPPIITGASCYGAAAGLCVGATPVTWHQCASNDALCGNSTNANIVNVYEYTRPTLVRGAIYVDDPDVINSTSLWDDQTQMLRWASGLPGAGSTRAQDHYQADMTLGSWWDDGTHLYIWMVRSDNPGMHIIEATTRGFNGGIVSNASSTGQNQFIYFSYLKLMYLEDQGFTATVNNTANTMPVWFDHNQIGGLGAGPVTNESGSYYAAAIQGLLAGVGSVPTGALTASEVHITYNIINWAGSHNGINIQGTSGVVNIDHNTVGTAEHNSIDAKCPLNVTVTNNYVHDAYQGTIIGADDTQGQSGMYTESDWNACTGGTITWQNNILHNMNNGIYCNVNLNSITQTCHAYNNTVDFNSAILLGTAGLLYADHGGAATILNLDAENNIVYSPVSNGRGWEFNVLGTGTHNIVEQYNDYFTVIGTPTNVYNSVPSTTLASWQANCGGGGACGAHDLWQVDPIGVPNVSVSISAKSPVIGAGNVAVGTSTTLGGAPVSPCS